MNRMENKYLIWWTLNETGEIQRSDSIEKGPDISRWLEDTPEYIINAYDDRQGRNGRGRLWCFVDGMPESICWSSSGLAELLSGPFGGIMILTKDLKFIQYLPGIITDFSLQPVNSDISVSSEIPELSSFYPLQTLSNYLIWWVKDAIEYRGCPDWINGTPEYIKQDYVARIKHLGKGFFWCENNPLKLKNEIYPKTGLRKLLIENFGGIIVNKLDVLYICNFAGIVTDFNYRIQNYQSS